MRIDLHTHSTASDGTDRPADLVRAAAANGIDVVSITDHDTTSGWAEAADTVVSDGLAMDLVRGMEMSCIGRGADGDPVPVHLLAYLFDPEHAALARERARLRDERRVRLRAMADRLAADGYAVDADEIEAKAGPSAGRPHLARALVDAGAVATVGDAFASLLATSSPYYVDKQDTPLDDAVAMVTEAGGVAVIAHARARLRGRILADEHIRDLAAGGLLGGLEVDHADHDAPDAAFLREIAVDHGLIVTGSSDYHGDNKTIPLAAHTTAPDQLEALLDRAHGVPVIRGRR